jgi:hypothetical protein
MAPHVTGLDPTQEPELQVSVRVHALPSSQTVPLGAGGLEHVPDAGLQMPATWHWSEAVQATEFEPTHAPAEHASVCVHALPSLQLVPSAAAGFEQAPLVGSQAPARWHWSLALHVTGFDPVHVPPEHAYVCSHLLLPVHAVPSGAVGFEHVPVAVLHVPTEWH